MLDLTIIILTFNEENNLPGCLKSLEGIPANIFVVDSYSTDNTVEILRAKNIKYAQHSFINYAIQRNWGQENDPFKSSWVLHIDADERLTPELKDWLVNDFYLQKGIDGFIFSRRAVFMGKWIRFGGHYPNYHLILFKKSCGRCEDKAYDQHFICNGKKEIIRKKDVINILSDNLENFISRHNKWSLLEAIEIIKEIKSGEVRSTLTGNPIERRRWFKKNLFEKLPLFIRSISYFIYRYIFRVGFLDGKEGLVFHVLQGFWFRFLVDAKVYEIHREMVKNNITLDEALRNIYGHKFELMADLKTIKAVEAAVV
jgi:glycosyltransferase involved in cell wall biosynthesis